MDILEQLGFETAVEKKPENNAKLEKKFVGALLANPSVIFNLYDEQPQFSVNVFTDEDCKKLFHSIFKLSETGKDVNLAMVCYDSGVSEKDAEKLSKEAFGETEASILSYASILFDTHLRRQCSMIFQEGVNGVFEKEKEAVDFIGSIRGQLDTILDGGQNGTEKDAKTVMHETMTKLQNIVKQSRSGKAGLVGVPTGLKTEDEFTGGYREGNLIILAARPGMGKSAKAQRTLLESAKAGFPVGMFTLEMSSDEVFIRMLGFESQVESEKFSRGTFDKAEMKRVDDAAKLIEGLPIYIDDKPGAPLNYIKIVASKWKRKYGIKLLIIDYLQLMTVENTRRNGNRTTDVGEISRTLKNLAKTLKIPIIALSQLSRAVETRGGTKRPLLSDLRESGDIEQDADIVQFIYRPEYYGITQDENGDPLVGLSELIFAKNRNGRLDTVDVGFKGETMTFYDLQKMTPDQLPGYMPEEEPNAPQESKITPADPQQDIPF